MKNTILASTIAAALVLGMPVGHAAEDKKTEHKHEGGKHDHGKKTDTKIPDTAEALWAEIDAKQKALAEAIAGKKADAVHSAAEALEVLVAAVPTKHADVPTDKLKRADGMAKNVTRALDGLHEESEEGHWDDVAKKQAQIDTGIKLIKQQVSK